MPGPFPGMDPYLEDPAEWQGVHNTFITFLWVALQAILPPDYAARAEERCYIVHPERAVVPDVSVWHTPLPAPAPPSGRSGVAALEPLPDPPLVIKLLPFEVREMYLHIVRRKERQRVVSAIELLSPTNKAEGTDGWRLYRQKQHQMLDSRTHFIEIDLLRQGEHTVAAPAELLLQYGYWDYIVCLHRGGQDTDLEVWMSTIRQRLPRIAVPLDEGDPDVTLDLQAVFDRYYDEGGYNRDLDYTQEPVPPLKEPDAVWADALLRAKGLRP
jgi:hypothetical protein